VLGRDIGDGLGGNPPPQGTLGRIAQGQMSATERVTVIQGGNNHVIAFTDEYRLFGFGSGSNGRLGLGDTTSRHSPTLIGFGGPPVWDQEVIYGFGGAARGGGSSTVVLLRTTPPLPIEFDVTKDLRKLEGVTIPTTNLSFEFTVTRQSFNGGTTPADLNQIPNIPLANREVTVTQTSDSATAGGITTLTEVTDIFDGITFTQTGLYVWRISELVNSSGVNTEPPGALRMTYSQALYELRVQVNREPGPLGDFYIASLTLLRVRDEQGNSITPYALVYPAALTFTNTLRHFTTGTGDCDGALSISKTVEGGFADPTIVFDFDITLTRTALCAANVTFTARVYNANDTFNRNEVFTTGTTRHITLLDGQYIVFPELPVGVSWVATERAIDGFTAALEQTLNGTAHPRVTNATPNLALSTGIPPGTPIVIGQNTVNSADFFNTHFFTPPMGLWLTSSSPYLVLLATGLLTTAYLSLRARKRIEEMDIKYRE